MRRLKTFRTLTIYATLATLLLAGLPTLPLSFLRPPTAFAQVFDPYIGRRVPVAGAIAADDTDIALKIRYIGAAGSTSNSGTVEVAVTSSDMTFLQGAQGSEAASTEFECPVSGALGGIIDVSNAACNTLGEIVDIINASTSWRAVIIDGLRSDVADARLLVQAATRATTPDGLSIPWDTSTAFDMSVMLNEPAFRTMRPYLTPGGQSTTLVRDPFVNQVTAFHLGNATSTFGSGSSNLRLYSVKVLNGLGTTRTGSETVTTLYSEAGGATTANKIFDDAVQIGIYTLRGEKMLVRLDNSAAMASAVLYAFGFKYRVPGP